jgi:ergothioneine biosynthesis protein EgtB
MTLTRQTPVVDRSEVVERFERARARSRLLFDLLAPEAYYSRPIALRHPIVFYEGHLAAFSLNTVVKRALGRPGVDERLERLFARGIDPDDQAVADRSGPSAWPARDDVRAFVEAADRLVRDALLGEDLDRPGHPLLDRGQAVLAVLEHEEMHQETMLYMWHQLPHEQKRRPVGAGAIAGGRPPARETIPIPAGRVTLGARAGEILFGWDNEFEAIDVEVPAFRIDRHDVTNEAYLEFVEAGGYRDDRWWTTEALEWIRAEAIDHPRFWTRRDGRWHWRGMFEEIPLPAAWPVYVSQSEAAAFARWKGARLPSEAEFHRAAYGTASGDERPQPWGDQEADGRRGNFDFAQWEPVPVGSFPAGRSAWGVDDLVGNGWKWTSSVFGPFPGFAPLASYPEYSADFFDGQHYVMKGASPATARGLVRRSFRNWFRPQYPYVYATFRCVREGA